MRFRPTTILSIFAVAAMCLVIFAMSAQTADKSTELSMGIVWHIIGFIVPGYDQMSPADQLYWQQLLDHPVRKTAHFLEYALLGALTMNMVVRIARDKEGNGWRAVQRVMHVEGSQALERRCASGEGIDFCHRRLDSVGPIGMKERMQRAFVRDQYVAFTRHATMMPCTCWQTSPRGAGVFDYARRHDLARFLHE